jgi:hypothetical protein
MHAALMPSLEGDEIDVALSKGFRQQHLHIIDFNPAVVATLKRRYPLVNTYGVSVNKAIDRMIDHGVQLDAINLDFCSNLSRQMFVTLHQLTISRVMNDRSVLAVSMLRGREKQWAMSSLNALSEMSKEVSETLHNPYIPEMLHTDVARIVMTTRALTGAVDSPDQSLIRPYSVRIGKYRSTAGSQTMLWQIFSLHSVRCPCQYCFKYGSEFDGRMP